MANARNQFKKPFNEQLRDSSRLFFEEVRKGLTIPIELNGELISRSKCRKLHSTNQPNTGKKLEQSTLKSESQQYHNSTTTVEVELLNYLESTNQEDYEDSTRITFLPGKTKTLRTNQESDLNDFLIEILGEHPTVDMTRNDLEILLPQTSNMEFTTLCTMAANDMGEDLNTPNIRDNLDLNYSITNPERNETGTGTTNDRDFLNINNTNLPELNSCGDPLLSNNIMLPIKTMGTQEIMPYHKEPDSQEWQLCGDIFYDETERVYRTGSDSQTYDTTFGDLQMQSQNLKDSQDNKNDLFNEIIFEYGTDNKTTISTYFPTPEPSPKGFDEIFSECESSYEQENYNISSQPQINKSNIRLNKNINRLKLNVSVPGYNILNDAAPHTSEVLDDVIDIENERQRIGFNKDNLNVLIKKEPEFIIEEASPRCGLELLKEHLNKEELERATKNSTSIKRRRDSYESPSSVSSCTTSYTEDYSPSQPKRKRGRPPKTDSGPPSPSQYQHLPETEQRYQILREKNNEASRKSRLNRKEKEDKISVELIRLQKINDEYLIEMAEVQRDTKIWHARLMKLCKI